MRATLATAAPVPFAPPAIGPAEIDEVVAVLRSGWLTTGPRVNAFERAFAEYIGAPHAVAVNSCTAALHLSLVAAGVGPGDEVITTPLTFCATANVIVHVGATPVFADIDPTTWNLSPMAAATSINESTSAIVPVHYAGRPADVREFSRLTRRHGIALIEDAAHCIEGVSGGTKIGTSGDFTCFSFYATKNLTTGEGGMVTTASDAAADRIRVSALHGISRDAWARYARPGARQYDVVLPGFKYNMMDLQAALGLKQLERIGTLFGRRKAVWSLYDDAFADLPITRPAPIAPDDVHARHLYTILVDERTCGWSRDALAAALAERDIATSVHFPVLHLQPYYASRFGFRRGMFPAAEAVAETTLSLPLSGGMGEGDAERVVDCVLDLIGPEGRR